jgi:heme exporter protein A
MSASPLIEASGVVRRFGAVRALAGVDLLVSSGEVVLLLGPNGAGKTTLLRALAGLVRPNRGSVRLAGGDAHHNASARATLGFVSHQALLYDDLTPRENLRFTAALHQLNGAERRIGDALARADLTDHADRLVRGFSRGMLQRLSLARATLHDPTVLLFDEPFTGLDTLAADRLRIEVKRHHDRGDAIIAVTHDPADLWDLTTRVVVLVRGKVVFDEVRPDELAPFSNRLKAIYSA